MFGTYRTLLAFMVILLHLGGIPVIGGYAVFGFYILSGYLMTLIMHESYGYSIGGFAKYALNRVLRIYPMYWLCCIITLILIWLLGESYTANYHPSMFLPKGITSILKNIFIIFPQQESQRLIPPAWALTIELFFYACIGLGLSRNKAIVAVWFFLSVLYHLIALIMGLRWHYLYFTIAAASLPFSTGALIFFYKDRSLEFTRKLKNNFAPHWLFFLIILNWVIGNALGTLIGGSFYVNFLLNTLLIISLSNRTELPWIKKKFDTLMGDFSYPIYLIHYPLGILVVVTLGAAGVSLKRPSLMLMVISIPVIFLTSWILSRSIEQPLEIVRAKIKVMANPSRGRTGVNP